MELIKIYNGGLVNARELQQFLEVKYDFSTWVKRMLSYGFEEGKEYFTTHKKVERQTLKEYYLTIGTAKEIAMLQRNEKGKEARKYFIQCEETLQVLNNNKRFEAFFKLETTKERLRENIIDIGGTDNDFLQIDLAGRKVLFNGNQIIDEELSTLLLMGRGFATELTNEAMKTGEHTIESVEKINKNRHELVRNTLIQGTGKKPEEMPTEERIKKLGE